MALSARDWKVLITAGPVWVPIDKIRVISNISTGATGLAIAECAVRSGARVTLILGPGTVVYSPQTTDHRLKIIRFKYYDELYRLLKRELKSCRYDVVIHAAAVSDYKLARVFGGKIKSGKNFLQLTLKPTEKIVDKIKVFSPETFLVMFKLQVQQSRKKMLEDAYKQMKRYGADLVVANTLEDITDKKHRAYIIDRGRKTTLVRTNGELAAKLLKRVKNGKVVGGR